MAETPHGFKSQQPIAKIPFSLYLLVWIFDPSGTFFPIFIFRVSDNLDVLSITVARLRRSLYLYMHSRWASRDMFFYIYFLLISVASASAQRL